MEGPVICVIKELDSMGHLCNMLQLPVPNVLRVFDILGYWSFILELPVTNVLKEFETLACCMMVFGSFSTIVNIMSNNININEQM